MTLNSQWSIAARNARLAALASAAASGFLNIYAGAQPANGDVDISGFTKLASIAMDATEFTTPASGSMTNADDWSATATATGTAGFCAITKSDGSVLWMGSVGTSGCNLNLATTSISSGVTVDIPIGSFSVTDDASISGQ